jgi:hypothetical protein
VINGGFFAHKADMQATDGTDMFSGRRVGEAGVGRPVGQTLTRSDHIAIPPEYARDYGQLMVGGDVGLSSGPMLANEGTPTALPLGDDRFQYRLPDPDAGGALDDNWRNPIAGVLTHAGDRNARAAISINEGDVFMQTVTPANAQPGAGATMAQWQTMTAAGAGIGRPRGHGATLNLDGGGSVFMGVTQPDGDVREIARGGRPGDTTIRTVANIIASKPVRKDQ